VALRNWPVFVRLGAVFALASMLGLVFGGLRVAAAVGAADTDARTTQLAVLGEQDIALAQAMEDERDLSAGVAAYSVLNAKAAADGAGTAVRSAVAAALAKEKAALARAERTTDAAAARSKALAVAIGPGFPASLQAKAQSVDAMIANIPGNRTQLAGAPTAEVVQSYSDAITAIFTLQDEIASSSGDAALADDTRALGAISRAKDEASQQRAVLYSALLEVSVDAGGSGIASQRALTDAGSLGLLNSAEDLQTAYVTAFEAAATPAQSAAYQATVTGRQDQTMQLLAGDVTVYGDPRLTFEPVGHIKRLGGGFNRATVASTWYSASSGVISQLHVIETGLATAIVTRSQYLEHDAIRTAILISAVTAAAVLLVLLATALVARSLVLPLRRLQSDALEIAAVRLPARVAAATNGTAAGDSAEMVAPIGISSTDEIGKVARAFDQVHAEAVRLAGDEAQLRGSLNAMFISLSRRSVPLIDKLGRMIDALEQNEDDPDQLADLFAMDHLVTRMRRNSENLLVLGGEEQVRKWGEPVPLTDVARAAASEIEQYNRVELAVPSELLVSGQAAADVVHLLAELIENATLFSPRDSPVRVTAIALDGGGAMAEVRDEGVGISESRLLELNFRLDRPPVVDVSVSRHMGLYAVSRLAARHGIRVRLRAGTPHGLSALVWLPEALTPRGRGPVLGLHSRPRGIDDGPGGAVPADGDPGAWAPGRRVNARHRNGLLTTSGGQPVLGANAGRPGGNPDRDGVAAVLRRTGPIPASPGPAGPGPGVPVSGGQQATAWFRAKKPSGGRPAPAPAPGPGWGGAGWDAAGWGEGTPGPGMPHGQQETRAQTSAGLPQRVPRAGARPGNGMPPSEPRGGAWEPGAAPGTGSRTAGAPILSAPPAEQARRAPEAARSRMSGFQLGGRDGTHAGRDRPADGTQASRTHASRTQASGIQGETAMQHGEETGR
jgi:signal transduction histidine kinase